MANLKQSKKRIRQDKKRSFKNRCNLSRVKTYIKKFLILIKSNDLSSIRSSYPFLISEIDKSVRRGIYHRNKADRLKSYFNKKLKIVLGM